MFNRKVLGAIAGIGVLLILSGLVIAATTPATECANCSGTGKTDCIYCTNGFAGCVWCTSGKTDCGDCTDGKNDCPSSPSCVDGTCWSCKGSKVEWCVNCFGTGHRPYGACDMCGGDGLADCGHCGGKGYCLTCQGSRFINCSVCRGTGWRACLTCGGTGTQACYYCSARGWDRCTMCSGKGKQTSVTALLVPGGIMGLTGALIIPAALIVGKRRQPST